MNENEQVDNETKCGYVAMIGRPNVGKSTLLNRILNQKLSIVTAKPQTTRNRILAIYNTAETQVIFLDTPGLHQPRNQLGHYMIEEAESAIAGADICVFLINANRRRSLTELSPEEIQISKHLEKSGKPIILLINKVDLVREKQKLLPLLEAASKIPCATEIIPISAKTGNGVDRFVEKLSNLLPIAPKLYPEDILSEHAERFFISEMIREALTELTHEELPYRCAVVIDRFVEETKRCVIHATIHVEKKSQKGIVIGAKGSMIKEIGHRSRISAKEFLGCPVELRLHVNVSPGWTKTARSVKEMGYE
jgi:GTP-binding protein Era